MARNRPPQREATRARLPAASKAKGEPTKLVEAATLQRVDEQAEHREEAARTKGVRKRAAAVSGAALERAAGQREVMGQKRRSEAAVLVEQRAAAVR